MRTFIRTLMLVAVVGAVLAPPAAAQTLDGETLEGRVTEIRDVGCSGNGVSSFAFDASGEAFGPYPGAVSYTHLTLPTTPYV